MQIKYGTDEFGNVYKDFAQIEPVGGTVCYNTESETLDEPITPDDGKRLIVENGKWKQIAISVDNVKDGERIRRKTQLERYTSGVDPVPEKMKLVDGELVSKTLDEQLAAGEITKDEYNLPTIASLADIDVKSVRAIREWLVTQSDCPAVLKTHETSAQKIRSGLKK